eukprot:7278795-Pyramimonas_sp.AAC.1
MRHPPPSTALRGPIRSSTEGPSGTARMRHSPPSTAPRRPIRSPTECPSGTARMRHPPPSTISVSYTHLRAHETGAYL